MGNTEHWPQDVTLDLCVHYDSSAPDRRSYSLVRCDQAAYVKVLIPQHSGAPLELQRVCWPHLPGGTLYLRCLSVLAVHLFGGIDMPGRVRGAPLWRHLRFNSATYDNQLHQIHFELEAIDDKRATLQYRCRRNQPVVKRTVLLDPLDADPLRALLRVGMSRVKPESDAPPKTAARRAMRRRVAASPELVQQW